MALNLNPYTYTPEGGWTVSGFTDQFGQNWRQLADGSFQRASGYEQVGGVEAPGQQEVWSADDPNSAKWGLQGSVGFDVSPYQGILSYLQGAAPQFGDPSAAGNQDLLREWMSNPVGLFDSGYNSVSRNSLNPYFTTGVRDSIRGLARQLGLTGAQADEIALSKAQSDYSATGQGRSDATAVANLADDLARAVFEKAGKGDLYRGLTTQQRNQYADAAAGLQNRNKEGDENAWKRDEIASIVWGVPSEQVQSAWEKGTTDNGLPSEQAFVGADNPWNTWLQNQLRNKDYDPYGNEFGLATEEQYQNASSQGYDVGAAALLQKTAQLAASAYLGQTGAVGELSNPVIEGGANAAGIDPSYIDYAKDAKNYADYYKAYQNWQAGGEVNPGALFNVATKAVGKVGDFDTSAYLGGDSPYDSTSYFNESQYGNYAGGNMFDENGNWVDGGYDQNGDFIPNDSNPNSGWYDFNSNGNTGSGFDEFGNPLDGGQAPFQDENGNIIGGGGGGDGGGGGTGGLGGLGSLFSGLGGGLSNLLGSTGNGGNSLLALAPILAAIQYARNQSPFDTSRLTNLADKYNPDAMAYQYDRNTEDQRRSLTSSLSDRGVMGSSFGNMDVTNFNTNRELGRGALISQASLGGADIAQKILQAQVQERQLRNQMYGSSLSALGNVFGARKA